MTAAAAVEPTELEELMEAQAEAAHEREVGDATRPTAEDLAASPTRIDVEGLDLFYGDHHALKDVNIKIRDKQITSFIGPSGCGKSTLLRCFNRMNDGIRIAASRARLRSMVKISWRLRHLPFAPARGHGVPTPQPISHEHLRQRRLRSSRYGCARPRRAR